jgi:hypothetical protein
MQLISKTFSPVYFLVLVIFFSGICLSCNDTNKCDFVACANGGSCVDGGCICVTGYQGPTCQTMSTTDFIGNNSVWDSGTLFGPVTYPLNITQGAVVTTMVIKNLYYGFFSDTVNAYISGPSTITIPSQIILGKIVYGQGFFYNSQQIVINYQVTDNSTGIVDNHLLTWIRQ